MTLKTAQIATEAGQTVDYGLPEYSEEELAEIEKEDAAYLTPEKIASLREKFDRIDKIFGRHDQAAV